MMAVIWEKYRIGLNKRDNSLFIGRGEIAKNGVIKWLGKSPDRTAEIIQWVAMKMKIDIDKRDDGRPWVGYSLPGIGKLILVKPGYKFEIKQ